MEKLALKDISMPDRQKIYREKKSGVTAKDIMTKYNLKNIGVVHNLMTLTKPKGAKPTKVSDKRGNIFTT